MDVHTPVLSQDWNGEEANELQFRENEMNDSDLDSCSETGVLEAVTLWDTESDQEASEPEINEEEDRRVLREARTLMRTLREIGNHFNFEEPEWCRIFSDDSGEDDDENGDDDDNDEDESDCEENMSAEYLEMRKKTERLKTMLNMLRSREW